MASGAAPANLVFPSGTDVYSTKVDRNVVISGEAHTIPAAPGPYEVALDYVPLQASPSTVSIPGYTEVSGTPATFEFNVLYSGTEAGLLTFNSLQSGLSITATYTTFGDTIEAENINSLQTAMVNTQSYVLANVASGSFVPTSGGSMTGDLVMNADINLQVGNIITDVSGTNSIGVLGTPLSAIYSDTIVSDSVTTANPLTLTGSEVHIVPTTGDADVDSTFKPAASGTYDLGAQSAPWDVLYFNTVGKSAVLASGINIAVLVSGTNDVGSVTNPLNALYVDTITAGLINSPSIAASGSYVLKAGDTMTGDLTVDNSTWQLVSANPFQSISILASSGATVGGGVGDISISTSANISIGASDELSLVGNNGILLGSSVTPTVSGNWDIGTAAFPLRAIYADSLVSSSGVGVYVPVSGGQMFGDLDMTTATIRVNDITNAHSSSATSITNAASGVTFQVGATDLGLEINAGASYAKFATNGGPSPGTLLQFEAAQLDMTDGDHVEFHPNNSQTKLTLNTSSGVTLHATGNVDSNVDIMAGPSGATLSLLADQFDYNGRTAIVMNNGNINISGHVVPYESGTQNLGSPSLPYRRVYADELVDTSGSSIYVEKAGDTMTGDLNMTAHIIPTVSGTYNLGSMDYPFESVYADNIINTSGASIYVLKAGDTMTGDLNVSGATVNTDSIDVFTPTANLGLGGTATNVILDPTNGDGTGANRLSINSGGPSAVHSSAYNFLMAVPNVQFSGNALPTTSGTNDLGSAALPWRRVYADELVDTSGSSIYVEKAGDTMTGDLTVNADINVADNISGTASYLDIKNATGIYIHRNDDASYIDLGDTETNIDGAVRTAVYASGTKYIELNANSFGSAGLGKIAAYTDIIPNTSGTHNIGTAALPFEQVFTKTLNATTISGLSPINIGNQIQHEGSTASGLLSVAFGTNSTAGGSNSIAVGQGAEAAGNSSVALGGQTGSSTESIASGTNSVALGGGLAIGNASFAVGEGLTGGHSVAYGNYSIAIGHGAEARVAHSTAIGEGVTASGDGAVAFGGDTTRADGVMSFAAGSNNDATANYSTVFGAGNTTNGTYSFAVGQNNTTHGTHATAIGNATIASGNFSLAMGEANHALGESSFAGGQVSRARGLYSFAWGQGADTGSGLDGTVNIADSNGSSANTQSNSMVLSFENGIKLESTVNVTSIYPETSGSNTLGTAALPFEQVFTKTLNATNISGLSPINITADNIDLNGTVNVNGTLSGSSFTGETKILNYVIDGGGSVIASGSVGTVELPYDATPLSWNLIADVSGSLSVDVRRQTHAQWSGVAAVTSADSIVGTEKPDITAGFKGQDTALTTWSGLSNGDYLNFHVDANPTNITNATLSIKLRKDS